MGLAALLRRGRTAEGGGEVASPASPGDPPDRDELLDGELGESGARMSFLEHLDELRRRLVAACLAILAGCVVSFAFITKIYDFIMKPLAAMLPAGSRMIYTEPTEAFVLYLKLALLSGIVLASPVVLWQVWLFIAPGLYAREKRIAIPFIFFATVGFVAGAAFSHYLLFPWMWRFLASFANDYMMFAPKIESVFSLYTKMLLGMALIFQMPTVVYFLSRIGLVTARFLIRQFKFAVLIIFVVAALITPTGDMLTQTLFAAPMIGLYLLSIVIAWVVGVGRRRRQKAVQAAA